VGFSRFVMSSMRRARSAGAFFFVIVARVPWVLFSLVARLLFSLMAWAWLFGVRTVPFSLMA
jgi:hypothetical protein